jgi:enamine deaminase RidA (YjgF/YER057c/UK114 family)
VFPGASGQHARSAVGVASLPLDAPVEVELVVALDPARVTG